MTGPRRMTGFTTTPIWSAPAGYGLVVLVLVLATLAALAL
jgi:hypothetical protein